MRCRVQIPGNGGVCTAQKETQAVCGLQACLSVVGLNLRKPPGQRDSDGGGQRRPAARGGDSWASGGPQSLIPATSQTRSAEPRALLLDVWPLGPHPALRPGLPNQTLGVRTAISVSAAPRRVWATLKFENRGLTTQCPVSILQKLVRDTASGRCWASGVQIGTSRDPPGTGVRVNI